MILAAGCSWTDAQFFTSDKTVKARIMAYVA